MHIRSFPAYHLPYKEMYRGSQGSTGLLFFYGVAVMGLSLPLIVSWDGYRPTEYVCGLSWWMGQYCAMRFIPTLVCWDKARYLSFFSTRRSVIYNLQSVFTHSCIAVVPIPGLIIGYRQPAARLVPWLLRNAYVSSLSSGCYTVSLRRQGDVSVQRLSNGALSPRAFSLISIIP